MPFGASTPEAPPDMPPGEHEVIHVDDRVVACDGGSAGLGPPSRVAAHRARPYVLPILFAPVRAQRR